MPPSSVSVGRSSVQSGSASSHDASDSHDVTADVPDTNARTARKLFDSPASLPVVASPPAVGVSSKQALQALTSRLAAISAGTPKQYELRAESQEPAISAASSIPLSLAKSECHESMPQPDSPATVDASPDPPAVLNVSGFDRLLSKIFAGAQSSVPAPSALSAPTASAIAVSPAVPAEACESDSDSGEDSEDAADVRETIELAMRQHRAVAATAYHDFLSVANNTSFSRMVTSPTASEIGDSFEDVLASDAEDSCDGSDAGTSPVRNRPAIQLPTPSKPIPFHKAIHSYPPLPSEELASPPVLPRSSSRLSARLAGFSPGPPQGMTLSNPASPICGDGVSPLGPGDASVVFLDVDSSFVLTPQRFSSSMPSQPKRHARSKLSENLM